MDIFFSLTSIVRSINPHACLTSAHQCLYTGILVRALAEVPGSEAPQQPLAAAFNARHMATQHYAADEGDHNYTAGHHVRMHRTMHTQSIVGLFDVVVQP